MKVIILAAGEGSRLRPLTLDRPKCLVEAGGRALLEYHLDVLRSRGLNDIVLVTGYLAEALSRLGLRTYHNDRYAETNMVWSLFCAEQELDGNVLIAYGDIVYSPGILDAVMESNGDVSVAVDLGWREYWEERFSDPLADAETLRIDDDGQIVEIGQKPTSIDEIQGQYLGLMKFTDAGMKAARKHFHESIRAGTLGGKPPVKAYMTDLLQALIDSGQGLEAVLVRGDWVEIDSFSDLELEITARRLSSIETDARNG